MGAYGALTRVFGGLWTRYGGWGWSRIRLFLPGARFDWEREAQDVWMNSVVALAISWLGNRFPRPLISVSKIARNGDYRPVGRHPMTDLWQRPNPHYSRRTLEKAIGLSLTADGNAYIYKIRDRFDRVCQLWWIPHYRILPTWPADGSSYIDGYRVWLDTAVYHLPPGDVIHIRDGIDPRNERLGLAAVRACLREVCTVNNESGYTASILKNSGVPSLVIIPNGEPPARPDRTAAERMKETFRDNYSGDHAGDPIVMAGKYDIKPLGFSPEEMRLDKLPQPAMSKLAAATGVAAMSLGLSDPNKTYANLSEANRSSWGTIVAIQELVGEALRYQLLPEPIQIDGRGWPGCDPREYTVEYDYAHIQELQESLDALHARTREDWKEGLIRQNEAREQLGYEPDPDGDRFRPGTGGPGDEPPEPPAGSAGAVADDEGVSKYWDTLDWKRNYARDSDGQFAATGSGGGHGLAAADAAKCKELVAAAREKGVDIKIGHGPPANASEAKAAARAAKAGNIAVATHQEPRVEVVKRGDVTTHRFVDPNVSRIGLHPDSPPDAIWSKTYPDPDRAGRWISSRKSAQSEPDKTSFKSRGQAIRASKKHMKEEQAAESEHKIVAAKHASAAVKAAIEDTPAKGWKARIKVISGGGQPSAGGPAD